MNNSNNMETIWTTSFKDLSLNCVIVRLRSFGKGAGILAIEVSIDGKKFVFCTVYRVGNLDEPNHASIMSTIKNILQNQKP